MPWDETRNPDHEYPGQQCNSCKTFKECDLPYKGRVAPEDVCIHYKDEDEV